MPLRAVVFRELLTTLRRVSTFGMLALFTGFAIFVVYALMPADLSNSRNMAPVSATILFSLALTLIGVAVVYLPLIGAISLTTEKEGDTLDLLRAANLRTPMLVSGKIAGAASVYLLLFMGALPALAATQFTIGLEPRETLLTLCAVLSTALCSVTFGVMVSALVSRTHFSAPLSLIAIPVVLMGVAFPLAPILITSGIWDPTDTFRLYQLYQSGSITNWAGRNGLLLATSPLGYLLLLGEGQTNYSHLAALLTYNFVLSRIFFGVSVYRLERPAKPRKDRGLKPIDDARTLDARRRRFPYYLIDPRKRKKPIADGANPVYVRETRFGVFERSTTIVRLFYVASALMFALLYLAAVDSFLDPFWLSLQIVLLCVIAPSIVISMMTKDDDSDTTDMVRMTLLDSDEVFMGKLKSIGIVCTPFFLVYTFTSVLAIAFMLPNSGMSLHAFFAGAVSVYFSIGVALVCAQTIPNPAFAYLTCYVALGLSVVLPASIWSATAPSYSHAWASHSQSYVNYSDYLTSLLLDMFVHPAKVMSDFWGIRRPSIRVDRLLPHPLIDLLNLSAWTGLSTLLVNFSRILYSKRLSLGDR